MRSSEVVIGAVYVAKVSRRLVPVLIIGPVPTGGFLAYNLDTGRRVFLRTAARLRERLR